MHKPVMLERCVELLAPCLERPNSVFVDATLGLGGHSEAVLEAYPGTCLIGIDRDDHALTKSAARLSRFKDRITLVKARHEELSTVLKNVGQDRVDGILFDLGVSSMQLDELDRGFSYRNDAPLDMRMDKGDELTAAIVLNTYEPGDLVRILRDYGEERNAKRIVGAVVRRRKVKPLSTTGELVEILDEAIPAPARRTGGNPAKRTFQALRIEVNGELKELEQAITDGIDHLKVEGRMVVMSYHSLEDRIVKRRFASGAKPNVPHGLPVIPHDSRPYLRLITKGVEVPSEEEVGENRRATSAKLRAVEILREAA